MIRIKIVSTGSTGNCTILTDNVTGKSLVMDCGVCPPPRLKYENVLGIFITHSHSDHTHNLKDYRMKDVYGTFEELSVNKILKVKLEKPHFVKPYDVVKLGPFTVACYPALHDSPNPLHYLVATNEDMVWYGCDAYNYPDDIISAASTCRKILVDCNYDMDMMNDDEYNLRSYSGELKERIIFSGHASNQTIRSLFENSLGKLVLMHTSENYNDKRHIRKVFGKSPIVVTVKDCPRNIR